MKSKFFLSFCFLLFISSVFYAQVKEPSPADRGMAAEDFRRGVQSYYRGAFNDSILEFEKALSYIPNEPLILDWLGKAYYKSGVESAALDQWEFATDLGYGGVFLQNKMEIISNRRLSSEYFSKNTRYVTSTTYPGSDGDNMYFSQPVSILPQPNGNIWALAYGSNELLDMDVNGTIRNRIRGPLTGFDRPMDLIQLRNGNLLMTEYSGDRVSFISPDGKYISSFGKSGRGDGELLGPQYSAQDSNGNIYVTDFGNARVSVFSESGEFLFNFGEKKDYKTRKFKGFAGPTGIVIVDDIIYVADMLGGIYTFDVSGNFLDVFVLPKTFSNPEALRYFNDSILVSDSNVIYSVDIATGSVYETAKLGKGPIRACCATVDSNSNLVVADFGSNEINVMSRMNELVGGFFVDVEKINAEKFPRVTLDVRVENRFRQSIVGLNDVNFYISEDSRAAGEVKFEGSVMPEQNTDIVIVLDRNINSAKYTNEIESAIQEIAKSMDNKGFLTLVSAGAIPVIEYTGSPSGCEDFSVTKLNSGISENTALDSAIRLAANNLIANSTKRGIIFISDGKLSELAFSKYPVAEISAFLGNNGISFSTILLKQSGMEPQLDYLTSHLKGQAYYVYRPEGLSSVLKDINNISSGLYRLSFTSSLNSGYGRDYLPVEVEVYLHNRSGKDETGYFSPLE